MIGPLFDRPIAPPGKGVWVNGELTFPAPAATPTPAVPVAPLSPSPTVPSGSDRLGGGDPHIWLRRPCPCGAAVGSWCLTRTDGTRVVHSGRL